MKVTETSLPLALSQWLVVETALLSSPSDGLFSGNAEEGKKSPFHFGGLNRVCDWRWERAGDAVPGMAVRAMTGMMGDMALSLSSSLGSRRWGKRLVSSATLLSGDDAGMMLSEVSSSSLSILVFDGNAFRVGDRRRGAAKRRFKRFKPSVPDVLVLVVRRSGESCQNVDALHLGGNSLCNGIMRQ